MHQTTNVLLSKCLHCINNVRNGKTAGLRDRFCFLQEAQDLTAGGKKNNGHRFRIQEQAVFEHMSARNLSFYFEVHSWFFTHDFVSSLQEPNWGGGGGKGKRVWFYCCWEVKSLTFSCKSPKDLPIDSTLFSSQQNRVSSTVL